MSNKYATASYVNLIPAWKPRRDLEEPGPNPKQPMLLAQLRPAGALVSSDHNTEDNPHSMGYLSLPTLSSRKAE